MDSMPKIKINKHNGLIGTILANDFIKKNNILKTNSMPCSINKLLLQNILTSEFSPFKTNETIKTSESFSSTSTDIIDSPKIEIINNKPNKSANSITLKTINDDSEIITDINTVIKIKEQDNIRKSMSTGNIYNNTDDLLILANLNFLSKIEINQKIFIVYNEKNNKINFELQIDNSYVQKISRWYYNQGRDKTIETLKILINISIEQLLLHIKLNNTIEIINYRILLKSSLNGLNNLKITYNIDKWIIDEIDLIIQKINEFI